MVDFTRLGAVVDECAAGAAEAVVEGDAGCEAEEALGDAFSESGEGACAVAFEGEDVFAGPKDRLDALADRREVKPVSGFVFAGWAQDRPRQSPGTSVRRNAHDRLGNAERDDFHVVDEFTREVLAIECARSIDADETVILKRLVAGRGRAPANLRADNGPELTARVLAEWCESGLTETAYIDPGAPWQNAWVESFNARLRDELLDVEEFSTLAEAQVLVADYRNDYDANHPHSALGMMTPSRFAASWQRIEGTNGTVNPELSYGMDR